MRSTSIAAIAADAVMDKLALYKGYDAITQGDTDVTAELRESIAEAIVGVLGERWTPVAMMMKAAELAGSARDVASEAATARGDGHDRAAREYALAVTHLEDAAMRYTRGKAHELGVFAPADLDAREAIEERHEWTGKALAAMDDDMDARERERGDG